MVSDRHKINVFVFILLLHRYSVHCGLCEKNNNLGFRRRRNRMDKFNQGLNKPGGGQITYTVQHTGCRTSGCGNNANNGNNANGNGMGKPVEVVGMDTNIRLDRFASHTKCCN